MKNQSKKDLVEQVLNERNRLKQQLRDLSAEDKERAGVWGDDWSVKDLLAHLVEWEQMFRRWVREGGKGKSPTMPAPGYSWRQTPALNRAIYEKWKSVQLAEVERAFDESFEKTLGVISGFSEEDLITPQRLSWTGQSTLAAYAGANTASHYRVAGGFILRWLKSRGQS